MYSARAGIAPPFSTVTFNWFTGAPGADYGQVQCHQRHAGADGWQDKHCPLVARAGPVHGRHLHRAIGQYLCRSLDQDVLAYFGTGGVVFPSISVTGDVNPRGTWSSPGKATGMNPPEVSPLALYTRLFGPSFVDPNAAEFKPNATVLVQHSVLSGIKDQRQRLAKLLHAADRDRLDAYFTSVRDLENQLNAQLQKPKPLRACSKPEAPADHVSTEIGDVGREQLELATASACGRALHLQHIYDPNSKTLLSL